jgi:hypothetical protein
MTSAARFNSPLLLSLSALAIFFAAAPSLTAQSSVSPPVTPVLSPPLSSIPPVTASANEVKHEIENEMLPVAGRAPGVTPPVDPVVQLAPGVTALLPAGVNFDGVGVSNGAPPDTNGRVGPNHYVQWVNTRFAIYSKTGTLLYGPADGKTLWQSLGGTCAVHNDGDPIVQYDLMADRWVLTQFTAPTPDGSHQCVAVSKTGDPLGQYFLYDFHTSATDFVDYPHWGVWPDSYYMTGHLFSLPSQSFDTQGVFAFDRAAMLAGLPARFQFGTLSGFFGALPSDLDSFTPPPAGSPNYFVAFGSPESDTSIGYLLHIWKVSATWGSSPALSITGPTDVDVDPFDSFFPTCFAKGQAGEGRGCIAQPSPATPPDYLDAIGDRLMYRLAYRNFGDHESLVLNHSVNLGAERAGVRWYELRNPGGASPSVVQQSTWSPADAGASSRWMGSVAMDNGGNIALGYSRSDAVSTFPEIDVAGRLSSDPLGMLGAEVLMKAGQGVQIGTDGRWGDYSAMTVDPRDGCTFWYASEYLPDSNPAGFNWKTRIASFHFPAGSCSAPPQATLTGTVHSCPTGAPLSNALVQLSNGFSAATDSQGHYTIVVPPGSYTAAASAQGRACQSSASVNVNLVSGPPTTQDFCLSGISEYSIASTTIDDSPGNGNGFINRDECFLVNVSIQNVGCLNASNVSATLSTSTPNVSVIQGSSPYPNLAIDASGANSIPFRLATSSAFVCGTPIALTLTVQDANGATGAFGFNLPTCGGGPSQARSGDLSAGDADQNSRLGRDGAPSGCEAAKACPGPLSTATGTRKFDQYSFSNDAEVAACMTIHVDAACGGGNDISSAAYLGSYDPQNLCTNYLGDSGVVGLGNTLPSASYSVVIPSHQSFVVIANTNAAGATCGAYTLTVSGFYDNTDVGSCAGEPPVANPDSATTPENTDASIIVVGNDSDAGSPPLTVVSVTQPANGKVTNNGDGSVTYSPNPNFNTFGAPPDSFTYTVSNGRGLTATAPVSVTVTPYCPLVATGGFSDTFDPQQATYTMTNTRTVGGWSVLIDPTAHSQTHSMVVLDDQPGVPNNTPKDASLILPPVDLSSASVLTFWHNFDFARFPPTPATGASYQSGGVLELSKDGGTTWIDLGPYITSGVYNGTIAASATNPLAGRPAWVGSSDGETGPGRVDAMQKVVVNAGAAIGAPQLSGALIRFRLGGTYQILIGGIQGTGWGIDDLSIASTLVVTVCNHPPIVKDDAATTTKNTSVVINVLANDRDTDGDPMTVTATTTPAHGTASILSDNTIRYTPASGFLGTDGFLYTVSDGRGGSATAHVAVTVTPPPNRPPTAVADSATTTKNTSVSIPVLANDSDPDGDPLRVTSVTPPGHGSATINTDNTVKYSPASGFTGTDGFNYSISDGRGGSATAHVTVTVTTAPNKAPTATEDGVTTNQNTPVTISVLANDFDPDGDTLSVASVSSPGHGTALKNTNGTISYTPASGFLGTDSFAYTVSDGRGATATATVTVFVVSSSSVGNATGSGWIPVSGGSGKGEFGFNAAPQGVPDAATGHLTYDTGKDGISIKGSVERLTVSGTQADFSGACTLKNGNPCRFAVHVEDHGDPGTADRFQITVFNRNGKTIHQADSALGGGNIQVH